MKITKKLRTEYLDFLRSNETLAEVEMKAALWKYDKELGFAFFCPDCKKFACKSGKCECGTWIDLNLPKIAYSGKVKF